MKILLLAPGKSIHSQRFLQGLLNHGCEVAFVDGDNPFPEGCDLFQFFPYAILSNYSSSKFIILKLIRHVANLSLPIIMRLYLLWKRTCPDITHVHYVDYRAICCGQAGLKPLVLTVWGSDVNYHFLPNADPVYRRRVGQTLAKADLVIVDAVDMIDKVSVLAGCHVRTEVVPLGIDTKAFHPGYDKERKDWRRKLNIPENGKVLLSIRGWNRHYRHEVVLEAFALALPKINNEAYLVFKRFSSHPEFDEYRAELWDRANELGIVSCIRLMEEVEYSQMPEIYAFADVIANYPDVDAFPVTFLEAAACERPVVSCLLPSYKNSFAEKYFTMVNNDGINNLSEAIAAVMNEDRLYQSQRMMEARKIIVERYDETISVSRYMALYQEISQIK